MYVMCVVCGQWPVSHTVWCIMCVMFRVTMFLLSVNAIENVENFACDDAKLHGVMPDVIREKGSPSAMLAGMVSMEVPLKRVVRNLLVTMVFCVPICVVAPCFVSEDESPDPC